MTNGAAVDVIFAYTRAEFVSSARLYYRAAYRVKQRLAFSLAAAAVGLTGATFVGNGLGWYLITAGALMSSAFYLLTYFYYPHRLFRGSLRPGESYGLNFSDDGILHVTREYRLQVKWTYYVEAWESPECYFLFRDRKSYTLVPKRAFASGAEESVFRSLLERNLGGRVQAHGYEGEGGRRETQYTPRSLEPPDWR